MFNVFATPLTSMVLYRRDMKRGIVPGKSLTSIQLKHSIVFIGVTMHVLGSMLSHPTRPLNYPIWGLVLGMFANLDVLSCRFQTDEVFVSQGRSVR